MGRGVARRRIRRRSSVRHTCERKVYVGFEEIQRRAKYTPSHLCCGWRFQLADVLAGGCVFSCSVPVLV